MKEENKHSESIYNHKKEIDSLHKRISNLMVLQGRSLATTNQQRNDINSLHDVEFKVFSQFGEDGIIQYLINKTNISKQEEIFIEFGVENYIESNTRFLLVNNYWKGLIFDGSEENIRAVKEQDFYWRNNLTALRAWIDCGNINELIRNAGISGEIGLLSIDVDGNDYWIWQAINIVNPVIVSVEWNSSFGSEAAISIPYNPQFKRTEAHFSNLYYGASIKAFEYLAKKKGYSLVGSNSAGNNLFFVRNDRIENIKVVSAKEAYINSCFRESRDPSGNLTFLSGNDKIKTIEELQVIDVTNNKIEYISDIEK